MRRTCTRCTRLNLGVEHPLSRLSQPAVRRALSTSAHQRAEDPLAINSTPKTSKSTGPRIRFTSAPQLPQTPHAARPGQLLRRTGPPRTDQKPRSDGPPQGALLRRTGPPQNGQLLRRTGPPRQGGRPGQAGGPQGAKPRQRRRRTVEAARARDAENEAPTEEELDAELRRYIDPPANPTENTEYKPKPQDLLELQKDWPNTPLSATGLSASVVQKIEWLARRLPHGYQTPEQLAAHFQKGNLTRFESEEEKKEVLKIAAELAKQRADQLSERKGSVVAAEDMGLSDLSAGNDKTMLVTKTVKGEFGDLEKQRMPFLDSVMRNLRNNETYHKPEMDRFMAALQKLMPANAQRRQPPPPQQQQQQAQKSA